MGPAHADVGWTLSLLGQLYAQGKPGREEQAGNLFERSLAILEKALGPEHPRVASPLGGLATLAAARDDRAKAESYYQRALAIQEKTLGPDHPDVAQSLESLAAVYRAQGDLGQSLQLLSRAADVRERQLELNLPLGSERQKLGYLRLFAQDIDRALSLHARLAPRRSAGARPRLHDSCCGARAARWTRRATTLPACASAPCRRIRICSTRLASARSQLAAMTLQGVGTRQPGRVRGLSSGAWRTTSISSKPTSARAAPSSARSRVPSRSTRCSRPFRRGRRSSSSPCIDRFRTRRQRRRRPAMPLTCSRRGRRTMGRSRRGREIDRPSRPGVARCAIRGARMCGVWPARSTRRSCSRCGAARPVRPPADLARRRAQPHSVCGARGRAEQVSGRALLDHLPDQRARPAAPAGAARKQERRRGGGGAHVW